MGDRRKAVQKYLNPSPSNLARGGDAWQFRLNGLNSVVGPTGALCSLVRGRTASKSSCSWKNSYLTTAGGDEGLQSFLGFTLRAPQP